MGESGSPGVGGAADSPDTGGPNAGGAPAKPDRLETWALATFDVVTFGLVLVLVGHSTGGLADVLPEFGTLSGFAVFGYLWALVVVATRTGLPAGGLDTVRTEGVTGVLKGGILAGLITGTGFVLGVVLVVGLPLVVFDGAEPGAVLLLGGAGTGAGGVVGGLLGAIFATLNVVLYVTARALVPDL